MKLFSSKYSFCFIAIIAVIIIAINFKKPMGFFRESNAALVCINTNVWLQNDFIRHKHIPVTTYSFNQLENPSTQLYGTCTTFGYGWFAMPYYFFSFTHLLVTDVNLRIFSLCWLTVTLLVVYLLTKSIANFYSYNKQVIAVTFALYLLSPIVLWYNVQGYVHEVAVLPFYFAAWLCFLHYLHNGNKIKLLLLTAIFIFIGIQFDWLPCMQAMIMCLYLFIKQKKLQQRWAFVLPAIAVVLAVAYIFYTYSSWAGTVNYLQHLQTKFMNRTIGSGNLNIVPFINHNLNVFIFYGISFGLTAMLFIVGLLKISNKNPIIWMMIFTAAIHHFIFWGFSSEHDHAVLKMGLPIALVSALYISSLKNKKQYVVLLTALGVHVSLYFLLHNYPLKKGMYADPNFCYTVGNSIKQISPNATEYVFIDTENKYYPQIEFYAGKTYIMSKSVEDAKQFLLEKHLQVNACFIQLNGSSVANVVRF